MKDHHRELTMKSVLAPLDLLSYVSKGMVGNSYIVVEDSRFRPPALTVTVGPHWPGVVVTVALIIAGGILNLKFVWRAFPESTWLVYVIYLLGIASLGFLLLTACTDPGIIRPRKTGVHGAFDIDDDVTEVQLLDPYFCEECNIQRPKNCYHW